MINTGSTTVNYGNVIVLLVIILGGIFASFADASANRQIVSESLNELGNTINSVAPQTVDSQPVWNSEYNTVTNEINATTSIQIVGLIVIIVCIAFAMFFLRGMA